MKKACMLLIWCFVGIFSANAQKFALIDMEYILENIPEYQKANEELNLVSQQYQKAIEAKAKEAETLYTAYQKAASSLNASQRTQKEEAIIAKEKEAAELRKKYFWMSSADLCQSPKDENEKSRILISKSMSNPNSP